MTQGIGCPYPRPYSRNNSELWRHHTNGGQYWHCEFDKSTQPRRSWFGSLYNARAEIWQSSRSHPFPRESRTCEQWRQFSFRDQELWSIRIHRDSHPDSAGIRDSLWLRIWLGVFVLSPCMFRVPQNLKKNGGSYSVYEIKNQGFATCANLIFPSNQYTVFLVIKSPCLHRVSFHIHDKCKSREAKLHKISLGWYCVSTSSFN